MQLTSYEQAHLNGDHGPAAQKAMQILATLGRIYGADRMIPVNSVQISGVSYANLSEAGLDWLAEMAAGGGRAQVFTTLNPAGMDIENYRNLGDLRRIRCQPAAGVGGFRSDGRCNHLFLHALPLR